MINHNKRFKTIITLGTLNHYADSVINLIIEKSTKIILSFEKSTYNDM